MSPPYGGFTTSSILGKSCLSHHVANVRFGSKADICGAISHVRFTPNSGHQTLSFKCLFTISCVILTEKGDNFRECVTAAVRQVRCGLMLLIASLEPMAPMLDRPSDDEVSRQILGVFMRHRIPASGILQRNDFFDVRDGDFQRGLNKAVANDWRSEERRVGKGGRRG